MNTCLPRFISRGMRVSSAVALLILCAASLGPSPTRAETQTDPIYNEETKSYFAFVDRGYSESSWYWKLAMAAAKKRTFKGVNGRLAVVDRPSTHYLLKLNFKLKKGEGAWIGMRYWCLNRKLQWVTGAIHSRLDFNIWVSQWYLNPRSTCDSGLRAISGSYMPVFYETDHFKWQASSLNKGFRSYFIEYPTGEE